MIRINYNNLTINRAIMHGVRSDLVNNGAAQRVVRFDTIIHTDDEMEDLFRTRMNNSFSDAGRAFELKVESDGAGTFFDDMASIRGLNDADFISASADMADSLAASQERKNAPSGFLILLDCTYDNKDVVVVFKAEPSAALGVRDGSLFTLKNVIMSPAQKLFKAAIFVHTGAGRTKDDYEVMLFDSQFSTSQKLAEYFYKDFLGLTISENAKIQTVSFVNRFETLIQKKYKDDTDKQVDLIFQLRNKIKDNVATVNPTSIINDIIELNDRDDFLSTLTEEFPHSFVKDKTLLEAKMKKMSVKVSDIYRVFGPTEAVGKLQILDDPEDDTYCLIRVPKRYDSDGE